MSINSLSLYQKIHCIGIGGIGISGLARILASKKIKVSGSDQTANQLTSELKQEGITVFTGHSANNLTDDVQLVVHSAAVPANNIELETAKSKNIPTMTYAQAVGLLTSEYDLIAVCGTHGKTTTTGLTSVAMLAAGQDPSVIIGAVMKEFGQKNERIGSGKFFILEACEYQHSFLNYQPKYIILNNIELDHLDFYSNLSDYLSAFRQFIAKLPSNGLLIANGDDENIRLITKNFTNCPVIFFGEQIHNHYQIRGPEIYLSGQLLCTLDLRLPGTHNIFNSTAALALCNQLGLNLQHCLDAINLFSGASRRFEYKGKINRADLIDDYAHHPSEIRSTIQAVRQKYGQQSKILGVFQPHQYSRTKHLLNEFSQAFAGLDEVIIPNIYASRDSAEDQQAISTDILINKIAEYYPGPISNGQNIDNTAKLIKAKSSDFDVILLMGAGDITTIPNLIFT